MANQTKRPWLEQSFVIKFLIAKKYKLRVIYRRMCDIYGEEYLIKKYVG